MSADVFFGGKKKKQTTHFHLLTGTVNPSLEVATHTEPEWVWGPSACNGCELHAVNEKVKTSHFLLHRKMWLLQLWHCTVLRYFKHMDIITNRSTACQKNKLIMAWLPSKMTFILKYETSLKFWQKKNLGKKSFQRERGKSFLSFWLFLFFLRDSRALETNAAWFYFRKLFGSVSQSSRIFRLWKTLEISTEQVQWLTNKQNKGKHVDNQRVVTLQYISTFFKERGK